MAPPLLIPCWVPFSSQLYVPGKNFTRSFSAGCPTGSFIMKPGAQSHITQKMLGPPLCIQGYSHDVGGVVVDFKILAAILQMCLFQNSQLRVSWRELQQMQNQRIKTQFWSHLSLRRSNLWKLVHMGSCLQTVHPNKTYYSWSVRWDNPANISILTYCFFFFNLIHSWLLHMKLFCTWIYTENRFSVGSSGF